MTKKKYVVVVRNLKKYFQNVKAVDGISFNVHSGEIFGLLGSNGAGKSTTLKIICGILKPTDGKVEVMGVDVVKKPIEAKKYLGYLPETPHLYDKLTGNEFVEFIARLRNMDEKKWRGKRKKFADFFELSEFMDMRIGAFSRGMVQKLAFMSAVLHEPDIIVLDEPMSGLDPRYSKMMKNWIKNYVNNGKSVLLSTHMTSTAEEICNRIAIIHRGKVMICGELNEILKKTSTTNLEDAFVKVVGGKI